jgi:hypothetical protein
MKNLEKISKKDLTEVLHKMTDVVRILNVTEMDFKQMMFDDDEDLARIELMRLQVFHEIGRREKNRMNDGKKKVAEILVNRDGNTYEEAIVRVDEVVYLLKNEDDIDRCYDILADELGLEPDYLNDLMGW